MRKMGLKINDSHPKFSDHTNLFSDSAHLQIIIFFEFYPYDSSHFLNCPSGGFISMGT